MTACTRATVSGDTFSGRLSTFETVPTETDAAAATSFTLTAIGANLTRGPVLTSTGSPGYRLKRFIASATRASDAADTKECP